MRVSRSCAAGAVAATLLLAACTATPETADIETAPSSTASGTTAPPPAGLDGEARDAWNRWQERGIDDYTYRLTIGCRCPSVNARVHVVGGQVVQVGNKSSAPQRAIVGFGDLEPTIDNVFVVLAQAQQKAHEVKAQFDDTTGMPTRIFVDNIPNVIDDEVSYDINNFTVVIP